MKLKIVLGLCMVAGLGAISATETFAGNTGDFNPPDLTAGAYEDKTNSFFSKGSNGECTWYVYGRVKEVQQIDLNFTTDSGRNAYMWNDLLDLDYQRLSEPKPGAIAIWKHKTIPDFGHVAYVEHVYGDVVLYTEANFSTYKTGGGYDGFLKHEKISSFEENKGGNKKYQFIGYVLPTSKAIAQKPSVTLEFVGMGADTVGDRGKIQPDGRDDGIFKLNITPTSKKYIAYIAIHAVHNDGEPTGGQVWDTAPGGYWMIGVRKENLFLNPDDGGINEAISENVQYTLFANDSGWFKENQRFRVTVKFLDDVEVSAYTSVGSMN